MTQKIRASTEGKKIKGRKRHIVTDITGHILFVLIHAANIHDTTMGSFVFECALHKYPSLKGVCADAGYRGKTVDGVTELGKTIEISERIKPEWEILPKRWRVERTFGWFTGYRRLAKDFEKSIESASNVVMIAHSMVLLKRLAK
jgi:transposase